MTVARTLQPLIVVLLASGCTPLPPPAPPPVEPAPRAPAISAEQRRAAEDIARQLTSQTGDVAAVYAALRRAYSGQGERFSETLTLAQQPPLKPLSYYQDDIERVTINRLLRPGEGLAYWRNWSKVLTGGSWDPAKQFRDPEEMRQVGNYAIFGILAHELGHYLTSHNFSMPAARMIDELWADQLAVAMMDHLAAANPG